MRMSKLGYFAEVLVFPVFFVVLTALAFRGSHAPSLARSRASGGAVLDPNRVSIAPLRLSPHADHR